MPVRQTSGVSLEVLRRKVQAMERAGRAPLGLFQNLAQEARKQLFDEFRQGRDPYGAPWAKTFRGGQILAKTGRLRNSLRPKSTPTGFSIVTPVIYAPVHNYGATIRPVNAQLLRFKLGDRFVYAHQVEIPRRQYLPDAEQGLGPIWTPAFKNVISAYWRTFMQGR